MGRQDPAASPPCSPRPPSKPGQVLAGLFLAALASNVVAALAGVYIAATITIRAMTLLIALALLFARHLPA